jgi:hypothetical protein
MWGLCCPGNPVFFMMASHKYGPSVGNLFHIVLRCLELRDVSTFFKNFVYPWFRLHNIWGCIQNIRDWRCKNHKTHHKAYRPPSRSKSFPPTCRHMFSQFLERFLEVLFCQSVKLSCDSAWISSMVSNRRPFILNHIFGSAKSGECGGWGMADILFFARNCWVMTEVWDGVLSWWSSQVCSRQS